MATNPAYLLDSATISFKSPKAMLLMPGEKEASDASRTK